MTPRPRLLLDCDPGIDDAFAIMCALRFADVAAITTVSGNVPVENTTRNARWLLELANAPHIPVHQGAGAPLEVATAFAKDIHGVSGLGSFNTPESSVPISDIGAVEAITRHCADGHATIVAVGPLTNIAHALLADPTLVERIDRLHWMGGTPGEGNTTPFAEFNAWIDPHAVQVTLASGCPISMYGLDLTYQVRLNDIAIKTLRDADSPTSRNLADFLAFYQSTASTADVGQPIHDACAVLGATHPGLFTGRPSRIVIETTADDKRGQTTVPEANETNHNHITQVDAPAVRSLILQAAIDPEPPR